MIAKFADRAHPAPALRELLLVLAACLAVLALTFTLGCLGHEGGSLREPPADPGSPGVGAGPPGASGLRPGGIGREHEGAAGTIDAVSLVVQKYGGTSVADPDRIKAVADHIVATRRQGHDVVVVVSAMGKTTDELERLAHEVSAAPAGREMDMLLTSGERISIALLCMAIIDRGEHAVSFTGSQAGIVTDTTHTQGQDPRRPRRAAARRRSMPGTIAVVAGFQGVSTASRHHDPRPRRLRHDRGRARRPRSAPTSARSTPTSPACSRPTRASCPTRACSTACLVRRDARHGGDRRAGARAAIRRVRPQPRRAGPRPVELHVGAGHLGRRGGWRRHGAGDHLGRHARHVRGEGHDRPRPRPPGHRGEGVPARSPTKPSTST